MEITKMLKGRNKKNECLSANVIQQILVKLLEEERMTKEELAEELDIFVRDLNKLLRLRESHLISKISFPLAKLFCASQCSTNSVKKGLDFVSNVNNKL